MSNNSQRTEDQPLDEAAMTAPAGTAMQRVQTEVITAVKVQEPRTERITKLVREAEQEANLMGEDCYWSWPVKEKNPETGQYETKELTGLSIDGSLMLLRHWRNTDVDCKHEEFEDRWVFTVRTVDLEAGISLKMQHRKARCDVERGRFDRERLIEMDFGTGQSKAVRNSIERILPKYLVRRCISAARHAELNKSRKPDERELALRDIWARAQELGVTGDQLRKRMGKPSKAYTPSDIATAKALLRSIEEGEATAQQIFGPADRPSGRGQQPEPHDEPPPASGDSRTAAPPPSEPNLIEPMAKQLRAAESESELDVIWEEIESDWPQHDGTGQQYEQLQEIYGLCKKRFS